MEVAVFTVKELREDVCVLCNKRCDGAEVDFGNFRGFVCRADMWRIARARSAAKEKAAPPKSAQADQK